MSLEEIEKKLFQNKAKMKVRRRSSAAKGKKKIELPPEETLIQGRANESFTDKAPLQIPKSWVKRIIVIGGVIFGLAVVALGFFFVSLWGNGGSRDIDIQVNSVDSVYRGVPFDVELDINNGSQNILHDAVLTLNPTGGLVNLNSPNSGNVFTEDVGDLGIGSLSKRTYKLLASGDPNSPQKITVTLSYMNGNTRFEVKKDRDVAIKESAITLTIKKPEQILSGSALELEVDYENRSSFDFPAVSLDLTYPDAFHFITASLDPTSLNNHWALGALAAGSKGSIKIRGILNGSGGDNFAFSAAVSENFGDKDYPLVTDSENLTVASSPINVQVVVNGRTDYTARLGDKLTYTVQYQNLSGIALADVNISASLLGEMFDFSTLSTDGSFNSLANRLTWNASNAPALRLVDPGGSGSVSFDIGLKNQFPIQRLNDKNFALHVNVSVNSPSVPYYLSASKTEAVSNLDTKVAGITVVAAKAFYRDADSGILNAGTLPPKVGQATQYTVHWQIMNYSTDVDNVTVSAPLAANVSWTGQVKSNIDSVPLYDSQTGLVTWTIPRIIATKGLIGDPVEAVFQVATTPAGADVGTYKQLLGETDLKATDDFTNLDISSMAAALSTNLVYDLTVGQNDGRVIQ